MQEKVIILSCLLQTATEQKRPFIHKTRSEIIPLFLERKKYQPDKTERTKTVKCDTDSQNWFRKKRLKNKQIDWLTNKFVGYIQVICPRTIL